MKYAPINHYPHMLRITSVANLSVNGVKLCSGNRTPPLGDQATAVIGLLDGAGGCTHERRFGGFYLIHCLYRLSSCAHTRRGYAHVEICKIAGHDQGFESSPSI